METVPPINTAQVTHCSGDVVILRLEIDDLWTFPQCSTDLVYNFKMAEQGTFTLRRDYYGIYVLVGYGSIRVCGPQNAAHIY